MRHCDQLLDVKLNAEKAELMWAGTRYTIASLLRLHDLTLMLRTDSVKAADAVHVLGVLFTPVLALDKHITTVSAKCFFQLCQLRRVRSSLNHESTATLVHAFVTSRIDYGNALLANTPRTTTDKLQRVLPPESLLLHGSSIGV